MVCLGEKGVSDLIVVVFMFLLLILASTFILGVEFGAVDTAASRQKEMKVSHFQRALESSEVRPGITALEAAAEQLVMEKPRVSDRYLRSWMENTIIFLTPRGFGAELILFWDGQTWEENYLERCTQLENYVQEGSVLLIASKGDLVNVDFRIRVFETAE